MKIWYKDTIYIFIHFLSGVIVYFVPWTIVPIVAYHLLQYFMDVRFFGFEGEIRPGNSAEHTLVKLLETYAGFLFIKLVYTP